jgi:hypothetical protein
MCYSAQIQAAYLRYLRETGAEMDIDQFVEIFGARVSDSSIRIPRAVERWFEEPKNDGERKIKAFIDQYNAAETTKLEREVFAQKKRLADAERVLASKPTKAAAESKRIATDKIEKAITTARSAESGEASPCRGADLSPALRTHRHAGERQAADAPGALPLPQARRSGLHRSQTTRPLQRTTRQPGEVLERAVRRLTRPDAGRVVLRERREGRQEPGAALRARARRHHADRVPVCGVEDPKGGTPLLSFAAITDEPPAEVAAAGHDRMIINIKPENVDAWLKPEGRSLDELQRSLAIGRRRTTSTK